MIDEDLLDLYIDDIKKILPNCIANGYININNLWTTDEVVASLKNKIDKASEEDKEKVILEILDTYDVSQPEIKQLLRKYKRYIVK